MKHFVSSYTKRVYGLLIWGREEIKWARDLVSVLKFGWCGLHAYFMTDSPQPPATVVQYNDCSATPSAPEWFEERLRGETNLKDNLTNSSRITSQIQKNDHTNIYIHRLNTKHNEMTAQHQ